MDKLTTYPQIIKDILTRHVELNHRHSQSEIETFLIIDETKTHYMWMNVGWQQEERVTGCTVYVRILERKFWIEEDWTEDGIANELVEAGVPKEDIVLAFHEPQMRQYTGFAIAF